MRAALGLAGAVGVAAAFHAAPGQGWQFPAFLESTTGAAVCPAPYVTDGDTIRCGAVRVRLLGIDAPELHGCPRYRQCAPGDAIESRRVLQGAVSSGAVTYRTVTIDRYGRSVALVYAGRLNLSCWQIDHGEAIYKPQWDNGGLVARACR